ncbi:carbohydrate-binding protein [Catenuloplanes atrovinosus]|uniref:CBM6 domain-containing protein n=1 Tax=Catenuloplanes atrovinosus TaxID=137266 RepID=A0AAE3YT79_9ACTN|nr:carbohydrate-binding protein [Catenuloplanes atrovinosus]MDR7277953.1 hypothetical protein [Catenuloplanes atrovinosus]
MPLVKPRTAPDAGTTPAATPPGPAARDDAATQALPTLDPQPADAPTARDPEPARRDAATQALPALDPKPAATDAPAPGIAAPLSEDTVILPALRGRTTKQERERPPTNIQPPAEPETEPAAAPPVPAQPEDPETPHRRGPSRAMIGVVIAVVLVLAAAWLLVSLPGVPGGADWAGSGDRKWPPDAPSVTPTTEQQVSAPPPSAPFVSPAPGQSTDNGLVVPPPSPAAQRPAAATPNPGTSPSRDPAPSTGGAASPSAPAGPLDGEAGTAPSQIEAESFAWQWGVTAAALDGASGGRGVSAVSNGDWLRFDSLNFGNGARTLTVRIANGSGSGGRIELRYDSPWSSPAASVAVDNTGGWAQWRTRSVSCTPTTGTRTVFISFVSRSSTDFVYLDWVSFA